MRLRALDGERLNGFPRPAEGTRGHVSQFAIRHSVHHRGQLSAYLRVMGAHVPAIYGESADEPDLADPPSF